MSEIQEQSQHLSSENETPYSESQSPPSIINNNLAGADSPTSSRGQPFDPELEKQRRLEMQKPLKERRYVKMLMRRE